MLNHVMTRLLLSAATAAIAATTLATPTLAQEITALAWCNPADADPDLEWIAKFEAAIGIGFDVKIKAYEDTMVVLAVLATLDQSQSGGWDVMVIDEEDVGRAIDLGLLAPCAGDAPCLAQALEVPLFHVDLDQVISKEIAEIEKSQDEIDDLDHPDDIHPVISKNLARIEKYLAGIFDKAEAGHCVLFFDKADAILGKR